MVFVLMHNRKSLASYGTGIGCLGYLMFDELGSGCFESSQPQRITLGVNNTNIYYIMCSKT